MPERRLQAIICCRNTYRVATVDGHTGVFWERKLRLTIDSSENGPDKRAPALMDAGMMGDRVDAIFATPEEISRFLKP